MENDINTSSRLPRWVLWLGIGLLVVGVIGLFLCPPMVRANGVASSLFVYRSLVGTWAYLIIAILLLPVVEEFAFRFWGVGRSYHYVVGIVLQGVLYGFMLGWVYALAVVVAYVLCSWLLRYNDLYNPVMTALTSITFALLFVPYFTSFDLSSVLAVLGLVGLGLTATWLTLYASFVWAIVLHVVLVGLGMWGWYGNSTTFSDGNTRLTLQPHMNLLNTVTPIEPRASVADELRLNGTLPEMATYMLFEQGMHDADVDYALSPTLININADCDQTYRMTLPGNTDVDAAIRLLEKKHLLHCDTAYVPVWRMQLKDSSLLNSIYDSNSSWTLRDIILILRNTSLPVMPEQGLNIHMHVRVDRDELLARRAEGMDALNAYLQQHYGLVLEEQEHDRMQTISFR